MLTSSYMSYVSEVSTGNTVTAHVTTYPITGVVSDGTGRPWKCRVRPPCVPAVAIMNKILPGLFLADVVPTFGMMNMIGGECDR